MKGLPSPLISYCYVFKGLNLVGFLDSRMEM